jgi:membrane fusion protein (multidrug efflux system)
MQFAICAALVICGLALPANAQQSETPAATVGTIKAERRPIEKTLDFVGRVEAINRVEIRARVKGYLEGVLFEEGGKVNEGDPLYHIEKDQFQAQVEQAQGTLERSKAALVLATLQRQRAQELLNRNAGTVVARDQAVALEAQAKGAVLSDEANLLTANIDLRYTDIVSPIGGRISSTNVTKGNVVGPDSGSLTMIVSQDPMYVTFPVSQRDFLRAREKGGQVDTKSIKVRILFADGSAYDQLGEINFIDVTVNRATDTVLVRATLPNPSGGVIDGQLVRVVLASATPIEKVVVPQAALIADQEGVYVFAVEDGKAAVKRVKPGGAVGTNVAIDEGLSGGEQVIVEGLQSVRPGMPVRATPLPPTLGQS